MTGARCRASEWWRGLAVSQERRLKELLLDRRELRGPLVGRSIRAVGGADESAIFVSGALPGPSPWRVGQAVGVYALQERPGDPANTVVRCAAEVVVVHDLGDGRVQVIARVHAGELARVERQNWPAPGTTD